MSELCESLFRCFCSQNHYFAAEAEEKEEAEGMALEEGAAEKKNVWEGAARAGVAERGEGAAEGENVWEVAARAGVAARGEEAARAEGVERGEGAARAEGAAGVEVGEGAARAEGGERGEGEAGDKGVREGAGEDKFHSQEKGQENIHPHPHL